MGAGLATWGDAAAAAAAAASEWRGGELGLGEETGGLGTDFAGDGCQQVCDGLPAGQAIRRTGGRRACAWTECRCRLNMRFRC